MNKGWIGVDLDGTLAEYHGWRGANHIGKPIPLMVNRVKAWLAEGKDVRIVTARISHDETKKSWEEAVEARKAIDAWCFFVFGETLPVTCCKNYEMIELWDDRCVCVERNTGVILGQKLNDPGA